MSAEATPATAVNGSPKNPGLMLLVDALLIAVVSTFMSLAVMKYAGPLMAPQADRQSFAIVNFDQLLQDYLTGITEQVNSGAVGAAEMPARSAAFNKELQQRLKAYAEAGVTVLRSDTVIAAPDDVEDITQRLRTELVQVGLMPKSAPAQASVSPALTPAVAAPQ
jgi:Skp family chaperone for outer membrane proteins